MRLQKELATLKVAHSELQCQHSTLTSSYGSLKDAHEKQTQLLKETTTRANTADAALHAQREGHAAELRAIQLQIRTERDAAALAVEAATERCATLEKEIKTTRLAWAESQETLQKVCAQRQDSFSSRMNEVSRLSRVGAAPPIITTSTSPPTEVALPRHASSSHSPPAIRSDVIESSTRAKRISPPSPPHLPRIAAIRSQSPQPPPQQHISPRAARPLPVPVPVPPTITSSPPSRPSSRPHTPPSPLTSRPRSSSDPIERPLGPTTPAEARETTPPSSPPPTPPPAATAPIVVPEKKESDGLFIFRGLSGSIFGDRKRGGNGSSLGGSDRSLLTSLDGSVRTGGSREVGSNTVGYSRRTSVDDLEEDETVASEVHEEEVPSNEAGSSRSASVAPSEVNGDKFV